MNAGTKAALPGLAIFTAVWASVAPAAACPFCRMSGDQPSNLELLKTDRSGDLRLDAVIDKFQAAPGQAPPRAIVTNAASLPARPVRRPAPPAALRAPAPPSALQTHVLDGGLIGLAVAGGIFCWRTRRPDGDQDAAPRR